MFLKLFQRGNGSKLVQIAHIFDFMNSGVLFRIHQSLQQA